MHERSGSGRTFWRCSLAAHLKCRSRITTFGKTLLIGNEAHNHDPQIENLKEPLPSQIVNIRTRAKQQ